MKSTFGILLLSVLCFTLTMNCKKKSDNSNNTPSAFADSLRRTCTQPFVGTSDSSDFYLPTAFTPNGDGIDDVYRILGNQSDIARFLLTIYDTTGTLVFRSTAASRAWDGTDTTTGKLSTKYKFYVEIAYTTTGNKSVSAGTFLFLLSTNTSLGCLNIAPADSASYEFEDQFNIVTGSGFNPSIASNETFCN